MELLTKIANALEVPIKKIVQDAGQNFEEKYVSPALQKKLNLVAQLPQVDQQFVAKTIDMLASKNGIR